RERETAKIENAARARRRHPLPTLSTQPLLTLPTQFLPTLPSPPSPTLPVFGCTTDGRTQQSP
ncbi:unnamed protein product, partial [Lampetra planeri]